MRHYEIILLIHPDQSEQVPAMIERYRATITGGNGRIHRIEDWGRRQLAYKIGSKDTGYYVVARFHAEGKAHGFVRVPHSVHRSAYGWIPIPVVRISNGAGPKVLMQAGNHGDEWEGQIALGNLIRSLEARDIKGRLVILPAGDPAVGEFSGSDGGHAHLADRRRQSQSLVPGRSRGHDHRADRAFHRARALAAFRLCLRFPLRRQLASLHSERAGGAPRPRENLPAARSRPGRSRGGP